MMEICAVPPVLETLITIVMLMLVLIVRSKNNPHEVHQALSKYDDGMEEMERELYNARMTVSEQSEYIASLLSEIKEYKRAKQDGEKHDPLPF